MPRRMQQVPFPWDANELEPMPCPPVDVPANDESQRLRLLIDERVRRATPAQLRSILDACERVTRKR